MDGGGGEAHDEGQDAAVVLAVQPATGFLTERRDGFRSAFSVWARDRTEHPRDVMEMALAHAIKDKSEAAYRRGDALEKRRKLMADWCAYCKG